jgi:hypothetical protein
MLLNLIYFLKNEQVVRSHPILGDQKENRLAPGGKTLAVIPRTWFEGFSSRLSIERNPDT